MVPIRSVAVRVPPPNFKMPLCRTITGEPDMPRLVAEFYVVGVLKIGFGGNRAALPDRSVSGTEKTLGEAQDKAVHANRGFQALHLLHFVDADIGAIGRFCEGKRHYVDLGSVAVLKPSRTALIV